MQSEILPKTENAKIFIEQQQELYPRQIMDDLERLTALSPAARRARN